VPRRRRGQGGIALAYRGGKEKLIGVFWSFCARPMCWLTAVVNGMDGRAKNQNEFRFEAR
jgi:hypothetical protein